LLNNILHFHKFAYHCNHIKNKSIVEIRISSCSFIMKKNTNNIEKSDLLLMNQIKLGDSSAFDHFFNEHWTGLYLYAYNILRSKDSCENIVQNVFIDFWQKVQQKDIHNPKAYLFKAIKYQVLNHIRNDSIHKKHLDHLKTFCSVQNLEDEIIFRELNELIIETTKKLPDRCREIFELSRTHDLSNKEIAEKLNISVQTVKNQISTALRLLRKSLQESI